MNTKKSHHFEDLDEPILKMYTVSWFETVFHKLIEENWKIILFRKKLFLKTYKVLGFEYDETLEEPSYFKSSWRLDTD
jgi:hypothetical protein